MYYTTHCSRAVFHARQDDYKHSAPYCGEKLKREGGISFVFRLMARQPLSWDGHETIGKRKLGDLVQYRILLSVLYITPLITLVFPAFVFGHLITPRLRLAPNLFKPFSTYKLPNGTFIFEPPTVADLLSEVAQSLEDANITYWLLPRAGLLPARGSRRHRRVRFSQWHEAISIGIFQSDVLNLIVAQTQLRKIGVHAVESFFGLRLFWSQGFGDDRFDYKEPFVDILYFKDDRDFVVNFCCDCGPIVIGSCTKKMCDCLVCPIAKTVLFPLRKVRIDGVSRRIPGPYVFETLLLSHVSKNVHPLVYK